MSLIRPKQPRLRLDPEWYEQLCRDVLQRDGWRCQSCGSLKNLQVHHKEFRSQSGDDSEQNLIKVQRMPLDLAWQSPLMAVTSSGLVWPSLPLLPAPQTTLEAFMSKTRSPQTPNEPPITRKLTVCPAANAMLVSHLELCPKPRQSPD